MDLKISTPQRIIDTLSDFALEWDLILVVPLISGEDKAEFRRRGRGQEGGEILSFFCNHYICFFA